MVLSLGSSSDRSDTGKKIGPKFLHNHLRLLKEVLLDQGARPVFLHIVSAFRFRFCQIKIYLASFNLFARWSGVQWSKVTRKQDNFLQADFVLVFLLL